ncbi:MAG: hypothetical protein WKF40_10010 [Thermoleophilaceae bacterium]
MLDVGAAVSPLVLREMLVATALNTIIALPVFWLCRRVLRPALAVDPSTRAGAGASRAGPGRSGCAGWRSRAVYMDDDGRRPSLTPQLALRVAVVGGMALMAFALIFFRLWYLQVLSGDKYRAEANDNRVREIKVQAPRGRDRGPKRQGAGQQPHRAWPCA